MYEIFDNRIESYKVYHTVPFAWMAILYTAVFNWYHYWDVDGLRFLDWAKRGEGW